MLMTGHLSSSAGALSWRLAASRTESTSDVAPSVASVSSVWGLSRDKNIRLKFCTKLKMVSRLKVPQTGNTEYLDGCG